ncbi:MAG: hypothetical protein NTV01_22035 [Bacteroidia bacterium]|nr:hypothetical protein [Bacteroidia bacterium]
MNLNKKIVVMAVLISAIHVIDGFGQQIKEDKGIPVEKENNQRTGSWKKITQAPLAVPRTIIGTVIVGNKLVVWGGEGKGDKPVNEGAIYDIDRDTWKKMSAAPLVGAEHFTMLAYGKNQVIIWGGEKYPFGAVYDVDKDAWKKIAESPMSLGMEPYTSKIVGNKLVVWGIGQSGRENPVGGVYDIEKDRWTMMPDAPMLALDDWPAFFYQNKFVVWGGRRTEKDDCHGAIYDLENNTWKKMTPAPLEIGPTKNPNDISKGIPAGRNWGGSVLVGNKLVIWSGCPGPITAQPSLSFSDGAIYDIDRDSWEKIAKAPIEPRFYPKAYAWGNKVVIWGGINGKFCFDGAIYDLETDAWEKIHDAPVQAKQEIYSYGLFGYNRAAPELWGNKLIVWGGQEQIVFGGKDVVVGAIYDLEKKIWEVIPQAPIKGRDYHASFIYGNKLIIWGGHDDESVCCDGAIFELDHGVNLPPGQ